MPPLSKVDLQQKLYEILKVLKEQDGKQLELRVLESNIGYPLSEPPELVSIWKSCDKIGYDPVERMIWYKHDFAVRNRDDLLELLRNNVQSGGADVKEIQQTFPTVKETIKELEEEGLVFVLKNKDEITPRMVFYNSFQMGDPSKGRPEYPAAKEFLPFWDNARILEEAELYKALARAGISTNDPTLQKTAVDRILHSSFHHPTLRSWQSEGRTLKKDSLMYPLFITDVPDMKEEIKSMPNQYILGINKVKELLAPLVSKGLKSVILFGVPHSDKKDFKGTCADDPEGPVILAVKLIRKEFPDLVVACDVCLCEFTDHGHCGILEPDGRINNQKSIERLAQVGLAYGKAGAHIVAPSDMMDGRIGSIKAALLEAGIANKVAVMAYSAKFASAFYGPFRDAANSAPSFGDRKCYQLPPNARGLAKRAVLRDAAEGADFVMVKPCLPYLDIVRDTKDAVSGEYSMIWHAAKNGVFDLKAGVMEATEAAVRAGSCGYWHSWSKLFILNWFIYVIFSTLIATAAAFLVLGLSPLAAGSGTPEVKTILGGFSIPNFLSSKTLLVKAVALPLTVASGLCVGKEGPMIHLGCAVGNVFQGLFLNYRNNEGRKREVLSACAAAGVAVAFGAPIGGVLFSMEELSSFFPRKTMIRSFFCALISCVTLSIIDPYRGKRVMYSVSYAHNWNFFETISFLILGLFGGVSGAYLIKCSIWMQEWRKKAWIKDHPLTEVAVVACVTGLVGYLNDLTRMDSSELLEYLFNECSGLRHETLCDDGPLYAFLLLFLALIFRFVLTTVSLGLKVPAGIFIPSMILGALFGRMLGIIMLALQQSQPHWPIFSACHPDVPCVSPGMYSLLGAIGALGGVTRMTISLTVIMFELTGTLNYIIPCMVTLMVAKLVGDYIQKGGVSDVQIHVKGYPFLDWTQDEVIGLPTKNIMTPVEELIVLELDGLDVSTIKNTLSDSTCRGFPVLSKGAFMGYATRKNLELLIGQHNSDEGHTPVYMKVPGYESLLGPASFRQGLDMTPFVDMTPITVHPKAQVELVLDIFKKLGPRYVIVAWNGKLHGIVTKKDMLKSLQPQPPTAPNISTRASRMSEGAPLIRVGDSSDSRTSMSVSE
ncbi:glycerol ethanol, ferric requiring protein [Chytridiales sp. JEL 0842]|nr:glycerol ethanol, ferric requiring protein [Chytridiales sp. JEL 0842]